MVIFPDAAPGGHPCQFPYAPLITLAAEAQTQLEALTRAHSTPQALAFRCRLILRAAAPDRPSNGRLAAELECDRHTARLWRRRYLAQGSQASRMRHGRDDHGTFPPSDRIEVVSLATKKPAERHCPATRWSMDDLVARAATNPSPGHEPCDPLADLDDTDLKPHRSVYRSIAMIPILTPKPATSVRCMSMPSASITKGVSSSVSTKRPACKFSSGNIPPNWPNPANPRSGSTNTSAMACGRYSPSLWCRRASALELWPDTHQ